MHGGFMSSNIERRRKIRSLEAKRDSLLENQKKTRESLVTVRAQLQQARRG